MENIMNAIVNKFCEFVLNEATAHNKTKLVEECKNKFGLTKDRKVFYNEFFAVRFSWSKKGNFSNTVLSLSHLQKYDNIPFLVVLASLNKPNQIFLANTTLLKKISHSSQDLAVDNIRGSFNGSDIIKSFNDIENTPANFEVLFAIHESTDWVDNLQRLCETSSAIRPVVKKYIPSNVEKQNIFNSVDRAVTFLSSVYFNELKEDLDNRVSECKDNLIIVSKIENNNIKGRLVEILITSDDEQRTELLKNLASIQAQLPVYDTKNGLGDYERRFDDSHVYVDIKVKIVYLNSNPKAFNIDKFLKTMAETDSVFLLYFVGFDETSVSNTVLCSVYQKQLLDSLIVQPHWAGRQSRGCAQYSGNVIKSILEQNDFKNDVNNDKAKEKLSELLEL